MNSSLKLVRWITVITLGCSLGLILVFIVLALPPATVSMDELTAARMARAPKAEIAPLNLSDTAIEKDLRQVIESQLAAFRQDDYPKAYNYAAAAIRAQVPLPAFERMVKSAYPLIAQSRTVQFGVTLDNGEQAVVNVTVADGSGRTRHYAYLMQKERNGWKVNGVMEVKSVGTTI